MASHAVSEHDDEVTVGSFPSSSLYGVHMQSMQLVLNSACWSRTNLQRCTQHICLLNSDSVASLSKPAHHLDPIIWIPSWTMSITLVGLQDM